MEFGELIQSSVAALLTVMVFSYLIGDNPLFRLAMHLLIGVAGGYAGAIAIHNVLVPGLIDPLVEAGLPGLADPELLVTVIFPWILVLLLLLKVSHSTERYGTISMALLVGVGAAVVVGGAISGTLIPQVRAAADSSLNPALVSPQTGESGLERLIGVTITLAGTLTTLFYFRFSMLSADGETPLAVVSGIRIPGPLTMINAVGKGFIAVTFGAMYAGVLTATLIVLAERLDFLLNAFAGFFGAG